MFAVTADVGSRSYIVNPRKSVTFHGGLTVNSCNRSSVQLVGRNNPALGANAAPDGVVVTLPRAATDPDSSVVALDFKGPLAIAQLPSNSTGQDGEIEPDTSAAYLGSWSAPARWLEYLPHRLLAGRRMVDFA